MFAVRTTLCHPAGIIISSVCLFIALRWYCGGANYLPSKAWYLLCFVIPVIVAMLVLPCGFCVPLCLDAGTGAHLAIALVYCQIDLLLGRWYFGPQFGSSNVLGIIAGKLSWVPKVGDGEHAPFLRTIFEMNGALMHEIFWNVFICANVATTFPRLGPLFAISMVPLVSSLIHGIVSNAQQGIRLAPQFLWVALSFHVSGNRVFVPGFIHALWYLLDGKLLFLSSTFKRDWDAHLRSDERATPPLTVRDVPWWGGFALMTGYYSLLSAMLQYVPRITSVILPSATTCDCPLAGETTGYLLGAMALAQVLLGSLSWDVVWAGMRLLSVTGDFTSEGLAKVGAAMLGAKQHQQLLLLVDDEEAFFRKRRSSL